MKPIIYSFCKHIYNKNCFYWIINYSIRPLRRLGLIPDEFYLKNTFRCIMDEPLDLSNPISFNQKLQWLKLYDRKLEYVQMVDKYFAKEYVSKIIGDEYIIPTIGIWNHFDEIDFSLLPNKFVLKATHGSGNNDVIICKDKNNFDFGKARLKLEQSLRKNCYYCTAEWQYKKIQPRIIAEQLLETPDGSDLKDYKFMSFNGQVRCSFVCTGRESKDGLRVTFFDKKWSKMPMERDHLSESCEIPKPACYDEMIELAERLSNDIPFMRVDFYEVEGHVYFGELTFYPGSGFEKFQPSKWDVELGSWIELPKEKHYAK